MWDSAKKPIKVRSVLQPNGMRHFIVNEDSNEIYSKPTVKQRRNSNNKNIRATTTEGDTFDCHQSFNEKSGSAGLETSDSQRKEQGKEASLSSCPPLIRSNTLNDADDRWATSIYDSDRNFFGVSGSRINNSKKHKGQHSRFIHQFPHATKSNVEITRYPHLIRTEVLDLVPVKSPVIKKLISGKVISTDISEQHDQPKSKGTGAKQSNGAPSTTLCSRIMTWIDLEVKRNAVKGKPSTSMSFNSADLNIVSELMLPGDYSQLNALSSSPISDTSSSSSSSGESSTTNSCNSTSSNGSFSSSTVSLPKLIPCWRKEGGSSVAGNKTKKSVRISEDLPRWGKMKRRLGRKSLSLNELYEEEVRGTTFLLLGTLVFHLS